MNIGAKYASILRTAGYRPYSLLRNNSQCWIKDDCEDINVCELSGLWAAEHATDTIGFGNDGKSLSDYLSVPATFS